MSQQSQKAKRRLSKQARSRVDAICERFEQQWQQGARPQIVDSLKEVSGPERLELVSCLLELDLEYRYKAREAPEAQEYQKLLLPEDWNAAEHIFLSFQPLDRNKRGDIGTSDLFRDTTARRPLTGRPDVPGDRLQGSHNLDYLELQGELGRGGMGTVYRAWDPDLKRPLALKKIREDLLSYPEAVERFFIEATAAARLHHPNVVPVFAIGAHEGQPAFIMPFFSGGSLDSAKVHREGNALSIAHLVEKIARGVGAAHAQGVVHRDIKPENILLDGEGEPHIGDFGLAKLLDDNLGLSQTGQLMGTPYYMSPEQIAGRKNHLGNETDVWSLGILCYELLSGSRPFVSDDLEVLTHQILNVQPRRLKHRFAGVDRNLEAIVFKCLEKKPHWRFTHAGELAEELCRWREGRPIQTPPPTWLRGLARRHFSLYATTLLTGLAGAPMALLPSPGEARADPEIRMVSEGKAINPAQWEWLLGEGAGSIQLSDNPVTVKSAERSHLSLLPRIPWSCFRYELDLYPVENEKGEIREAGLTFFHLEAMEGEMKVSAFCELFIISRQTIGIYLHVFVKVLHGKTVLESVRRYTAVRRVFGKRVREGLDAPHRLAIEVSRDSIHSWWDDHPIKSMSRRKLESLILRDRIGASPTQLQGAGLILSRTEARLINARVISS